MATGTSKGGIPNRRRPDDFEVAFVELGRVQCEIFYRAGRATISRWLTEAGKRRLLEQRKKFLKAQRSAEAEDRRKRRALCSGQLAPKVIGLAPLCDTDEQILALAARWLQKRSSGGWVVYELPHGWWMVGTVRRSAGEMLAKAIGKGFDIERAQRQIAAFPDNLRYA